MTKPILKIGTRGSPLALKQVDLVEGGLLKAHPNLRVERVIIKTSGDWKPQDGEKALSEVKGGKGLFVKEIENALLEGVIDCAVHSTKDVPSFLDDAFALKHYLKRADARDAFICRKYSSYMDLPAGAVVGTTSPRRQAFILSKRPDLKTVTLRGNVQTRLDKLDSGQVDAAILAMAGLTRLGITGDFVHPLDEAAMLPACGQGVIAIETRADDLATQELLDAVHHKETGFCVEAERSALQVLNGSCHTPIGAHARIIDGQMIMNLCVASLDGSQIYAEQGAARIADTGDAIAFGAGLAQKLKPAIPADLLV